MLQSSGRGRSLRYVIAASEKLFAQTTPSLLVLASEIFVRNREDESGIDDAVVGLCGANADVAREQMASPTVVPHGSIISLRSRSASSCRFHK